MSKLPPRMLTVRQAVDVSGIGRTTLYALIRDGHLDARKVGRRTLIPGGPLDQMLNDLPSARRSEAVKMQKNLPSTIRAHSK
jgi:excisionase family DNA binding protein